MRNRLEDFGRIHEIIVRLKEDPLFDLFTRPKYAVEIFNAYSEEEKEDCIQKIAYGLERIEEELDYIYTIASAQDNLNTMFT